MTRYPRLYKRSGVMAVTDVTTHVGETFEALVGNLSRGGIGLYSDQALTPGRNVQLRLTFLTEDGLSAGEGHRGGRPLVPQGPKPPRRRPRIPQRHGGDAPELLALIERSGQGKG